MHNTLIRITALAIAVVMFAGCSTTTRSVKTATETVVVDKSPVSGKPLDKPVEQLKLNVLLLGECPVPLPPPPTKGSSVDLSAVKKAETAIYYDCAYRHNALVKFLATRLGIIADEAVPETKSKAKSK